MVFRPTEEPAGDGVLVSVTMERDGIERPLLLEGAADMRDAAQELERPVTQQQTDKGGDS